MEKCFAPLKFLPYLILSLVTTNTGIASTFYALDFGINNPPPITVSNAACNINEIIPDLGCQDFIVVVSDESGDLASDIYLEEVRIVVEHTWNSDLDIQLTSPQGQTIELSTDNGSSGDGYGTLTPSCANDYVAFVSDLQASNCQTLPISLATPPLMGSYLPEGKLSDFNTGSPNGNWTLNICDDAAPSDGNLQYIELVFAPYVCAIPNFIFASDVDSTFANINWSSGSGCTNTVLEYGAPGFTPGTGTSVNISCPPYTLSNLAPNTDYEIYLRESCSGGGLSAYSCPLAFTTLCSPPPVTLMDDFDNLSTCTADCTDSCVITGNWFNISGDDTDWIVYQGATPTSNTGPNNDANDNPNGKYIYLETSCNQGFNWEAELYSQCIDVVAPMGDCHLSFDYMINGATVSEIKLQATLNGQNWLNLWSVMGNRGPEWVRTNIDLSSYDGSTMQFRFVTRKLSGDLGDVALDNIAFHGSTLAGTADFVYFTDNDGDSYGLNNRTINSCFATPPPNYALIGGDCNDVSSFVNPGATDTPCDGTDANCNPADDDLLPQPATLGNSACAGETDTLYAQAVFFGQLFWYDAPTAGNFLHAGDFFIPTPPVNNTNAPVTFTYYVQEVNFLGCVSEQRAPVDLVILPSPETSDNYNVDICEGESIDLSVYPFNDQHQTNFTLTYHSNLPADASNELNNPIVSPTSSSIYFIKASTADGCFDIIPISINVKTVPQPVIVGSTTMCENTSQTLSVYDNGPPDGPYSRVWTTGSTIASTIVNAPVGIGNSAAYTVRLTGANGCFAEETINITTSGDIQPNINTQDVSNCGNNDGSISLQALSGIPPFAYVWSGVNSGASSSSSSSFSIPNLEQGAYNITITDSSSGGSCQTVVPNVLVNGPAAIVEIDSINNIKCFGQNDGGIYLKTIAGVNPTYTWNNGMTSEDNENLSPGNYSVTINDNGCQNVLPNFTISEPDTLIVKPFSKTDVSCAGATDGQLEVSIVGGTANYDMQWSNGQSGTVIQNLSDGNYAATVTDNNGCVYTSISYEIEAPQPIESTGSIETDISCFGEQDGAISLNIQGGSAPYQVTWADGSTLFNRTGLAAGIYAATVTDINGCAQTLPPLGVVEPSLFQIGTVNLNDPNCAGATDGSIAVTVAGGTSPYNFDWDNGVSSFSNFNIGAGQYHLEVEDDRGCIIRDSFTLQAPVAVQAAFDINPTSCLGSSDGEISLDNQSLVGTGPFSYAWDTGAISQDIDNLSNGSYEVTVTDADNCTFIDTIEVTALQPISLDYNINHPNCSDDVTGEISVNAFGGTPFYQYNWSNGMSGDQISNLAAGSYTVTVTDADNCFVIDSMSVDTLLPISFNLISIDSIVCSGSATGQINLNITGGLPPYSFTWNGQGSITEDLTNVEAGFYKLDVADSNGCIVESPLYEVGEAAPLSVSDNLFSTNVFDCQSTVAADSLVLNISGGQQPYQVLWSNGSTNPALYNVQPDEYYATVTDALGCESIHFRKVNEAYEILELSVGSTPLPADCNSTNQSICIDINGGNAPYSYLWSDSQIGSTTSLEICRLADVETYSLTVTDDDGCSTILEDIEVEPFVPFNIYTDANDINHITCKDSLDGSIQVNVTGGNPTYQYYWEDAVGDSISVQSSLNNLSAGFYYLTVTDAIGCEIYDSWEIIEPATALSYQTFITDVTCNGLSTGAIDLMVQGGGLSYEYMWTNGATEEDIINLPAGFYGVTITDNNNCVRIIPTNTLEVTEPAAPLSIDATSTTDVDCFGAANGSINLTVSGGTPIYLYDWNLPDLPDTGNLSGLDAGQYACEIYDSRGCLVTTQTFTIQQPPELAAELLNVSVQNTTAEVEANGGTPFGGGSYAVQWSNGETGTIATNLMPGDNNVTVTDANSCEIVLNFFLDNSPIINTNLVNSAKLYPNPATDEVSLDLALLNSMDIEISCTDILGRKLFQNSEENFTSGVMTYDISNAPAGIYFLHLQTENQTLGTWRLMKE